MALSVALLIAPPHARGEAQRPAPQVGEKHEITRSYETSDEGPGTSSASSNGHDMILERVIAVRDDGLELEYDLPQDANREERAREWHFPARVLRQSDGAFLLLNRADLEARLERWLAAAEWSREVCGRWFFTWNAFQIDCDPESILETIEEYDLRSVDLREGAPYRDSDALGPGTLRRTANRPGGAGFAVVMDVDPDAVRRSRAEADVAVGEIMQEPVTLDAALRERAREEISGTIEVRFDVDPAGNARRRTRVTRLEISGPRGRETRTGTETVERRRISGSEAPR